MRVHSKGKFLTKFIDVRLGWAWLTGTDTTAFHATVLIKVLYYRLFASLYL
jgi:hypothetical protein